MNRPAAFISYARRDDAAYGRRITGLRQRLQRLVAAAIGRDFEIFQDCEGIAWGQHWQSRLDEALQEALFLLPIITPSYFNSDACRAELETFLELEGRSGRRDRILSLYFVSTPSYEQQGDPLAAILRERQHRDWRHLRIDPVGSVKVMRALDTLANEIATTIYARQDRASRPRVERVSAGERASQLDIAPLPPAGLDMRSRTAPEAGTVFRDLDAPWCPELVMIPAASFIMGSPGDEVGRASEGPQHTVRFAQPYGIGRYPVTFREYDRFCSETGRKKPYDHGWGRGRRPVINVSWEDAQAYLVWLGKLTGHAYRLPSEAEWEYACRAGTSTPFWTGPTISSDQANYDGDYTYGSGRKGEDRLCTMPVDTFPANSLGLHDMHGNVWEWCEDCWNDSFKGAPTDGSAWLDGICSLRAVRGGSWSSDPRHLRSAARIKFEAVERNQYVGFRISRTVTA